MNKILRTLFFVALSLCLTGCWTSIFTVSPDPAPRTVVVKEQVTVTPVQQPAPKPATTQTVYTTTVTTPAPRTTTVTTFVVTDYNTDPCFFLDLNAVAAAYAESRSTRDFEELLNSGRYMINNLDLNNDGWVDYLRVIETYKGFYHALLIQACLAPGVFQDVATLVAERRTDVLYVEVIGDVYLYGHNYIVRPVFVKRPPIWDVYGHPTYNPWSSPYYYGYFPSYYTKPKPVYLNHYQAYVTTYLSNHHYCHRCDYPPQPYNNNYAQMTQPHRRNDFSVRYPDNSFERRVTRTANGNRNVSSARNAGQLRTEVNRETAERSRNTTTHTPSNTTSTSSSSSSSRTSGTSGSSRTSGTTSTSGASRTSATTTSTSSRTSGSQTRQPGTTVETRVNKSGTTRTTVKTTDENGRTQTVKRESTSSSSSSRSSSDTSSSSSSSSRTSRGTSDSNTRSTQRR